MRKLFLTLAICVAPLLFWSCDEEVVETLTGSMSTTINGETHNFTGTVLATLEGKTTITSTKISTHETMSLVLSGNKTGTYTLGFMQSLDITSLIMGGLGDMSSMENTLVYYPGTGNEATDSYIVIAGNCKITSSNASKVKGTFKGWAVKISDLQNLSMELINNAIVIEGSFTAVNGNSVADIF
ncbi:MAG: hypothetical protein HUK18_07375 [Bacteroidales bacterium]|nr:hypothetical protein [Bacteroidales bacterium]